MTNSSYISCPNCDIAFIPINSTQKFCTANCRKRFGERMARAGLSIPEVKGLYEKNCPFCLLPFVAHLERQVYCSRICKERASLARAKNKKIEDRFKPRTVYYFNCRGCEELRATGIKHQVYCDSECKRMYELSQRRLREQKLNQKTKGFKMKLYFRDNGLCGICKQTIDIALKYPDPFTYSIDHIVPLSKGGAHALYNLQPAHLICNTQKSDNEHYTVG